MYVDKDAFAFGQRFYKQAIGLGKPAATPTATAKPLSTTPAAPSPTSFGTAMNYSNHSDKLAGGLLRMSGGSTQRFGPGGTRMRPFTGVGGKPATLGAARGSMLR